MFPHRFPSITVKLTFFYALFTSLLLILSSIFLYSVLTTDLEREDTKFLADEAEGLRKILKESGNNLKDLEEELKWEGSAGKLQRHYVRITRLDGKVLIQTTDMDKISDIQKIPFPKPFEISEYPDEGVKWDTSNGKVYLLMSVWAEAGSADGQDKRLIQLISDITDVEVLAANYRRQLFMVLGVGIFLASVAGALIARRGLKPLKDITRSIQWVSATQLHERIGREKWPRELASLAHEFDLMLDRLEDSFNRLSQFSADLAHELRTPINNLMGQTEVALSKQRTLEECLEVLGSNLEEYVILSRMIDSLLFLARAENPETVVEKTISEVSQEVKIVMEYYDAVAKEKGLTIVCDGQATLSADFSLFCRALSNLLSNAIQHASRGSEVRISIEKLKSNFVEVKVNNDGEGIKPEHLPKIFDRFYRVDPSRSEQTRGLGLGLAIVKSIMKLHGGTVLAESTPRQGTTFILRFPG